MARNDDGHLLRDARILIVEDETVIAIDLEDTFREAGAVAVERCRTVLTASAAIRDRTPTIAVLDIRLGRDTTESLIDLLVDGDIPFIFYSGQKLPSSILEKLPDAILVPKPGRNAHLVRMLAALLEGRRSRRPAGTVSGAR
jgi:DNA-binding NtrC family response regulator